MLLAKGSVLVLDAPKTTNVGETNTEVGYCHPIVIIK